MQCEKHKPHYHNVILWKPLKVGPLGQISDGERFNQIFAIRWHNHMLVEMNSGSVKGSKWDIFLFGKEVKWMGNKIRGQTSPSSLPPPNPQKSSFF